MGLKVYVVVKPPQSNAIHLMKQTIAQILTQKIQKYNDKYINIFPHPMQSWRLPQKPGASLERALECISGDALLFGQRMIGQGQKGKGRGSLLKGVLENDQ